MIEDLLDVTRVRQAGGLAEIALELDDPEIETGLADLLAGT